MGASDSEIPAETYEAIMTGAYRVLCRDGYEGLTMRKIAAEAGKSQPLLHYHFDTKDELVTELVDYATAQYEHHLRETGDGTPLERLDRYVEVALGGMGDDEEHLNYHAALLEIRAQAHRKPAHREFLARAYWNIVDVVADIVADGVADGSFRAVDPETTARFLVGVLDAGRSLQITLDDDDAPAVFQRAFEEFVRPRLLAVDAE